MTGKAKLPPVRIVPVEVVAGVASQPGRTLHIKHTLIWLSLRDGNTLTLETVQGHAANGEALVSHLLKTTRATDPPSERATS